MNKYLKIYVCWEETRLGGEIIIDNGIWVVKAYLGARVRDSGTDFQVLVEFVETRLDRLERETKNLIKKSNELDCISTLLTHTVTNDANLYKYDHPYMPYIPLAHRHSKIRSYSSFKVEGNHDEHEKKSCDHSCHKQQLVKVNEKPNVSMSFRESDNDTMSPQFCASCGTCGASLYVADHPSTFKEVFPVERPFCFHCGNRVDPSEIETDPDKYYNSDRIKFSERKK